MTTEERLRAIAEDERNRCARILRHGQEHSCVPIARTLAFKTDLSADRAIDLMTGRKGFLAMIGGRPIATQPKREVRNER